MVKDEQIFGSKLRLTRELKVSTEKNEFRICDVIENTGDREEGIEILYHMNMGYPLLDEDSVIDIPSSEVTPRDDHAAEDIANWNQIIRPEAGYVERCYYHWFPDRKGGDLAAQAGTGAARSPLTQENWMDSWSGR